MKLIRCSILFLLTLLLQSHAEWVVDYSDEGVDLGRGFILTPQVEGVIGYDDRVRYSRSDGKTGDAYSDAAVAAELKNGPSRYNVWAKGRYGGRLYAAESDLNEDFYTLAGRLSTDKAPFLFNLSTDLTKSPDANVTYNTDTGQGPDPVLTYLANTRFLAEGRASYDKKWFGKTTLVPEYGFQYYHQEYEGFTYTATEWKIHRAQLLLRQQYTKKTRIAAGVAASLQQRDEEDGTIGTFLVGMEHRMTKKSSWTAQLGYALADYEKSGTDQGVVSQLRGNWRYSKKVTFYVFGGNNFQPGYGSSSARWVYRLGYGARWQVVPKFYLRGSALHDYQEAIGNAGGNDSIYGVVRTYLDLRTEYEPVKPLTLTAGIRFNDDERPEPQSKLYLQARYRFY